LITLKSALAKQDDRELAALAVLFFIPMTTDLTPTVRATKPVLFVQT
jgi:hypothetical protein